MNSCCGFPAAAHLTRRCDINLCRREGRASPCCRLPADARIWTRSRRSSRAISASSARPARLGRFLQTQVPPTIQYSTRAMAAYMSRWKLGFARFPGGHDRAPALRTARARSRRTRENADGARHIAHARCTSAPPGVGRALLPCSFYPGPRCPKALARQVPVYILGRSGAARRIETFRHAPMPTRRVFPRSAHHPPRPEDYRASAARSEPRPHRRITADAVLVLWGKREA